MKAIYNSSTLACLQQDPPFFYCRVCMCAREHGYSASFAFYGFQVSSRNVNVQHVDSLNASTYEYYPSWLIGSIIVYWSNNCCQKKPLVLLAGHGSLFTLLSANLRICREQPSSSGRGFRAQSVGYQWYHLGTKGEKRALSSARPDRKPLAPDRLASTKQLLIPQAGL